MAAPTPAPSTANVAALVENVTGGVLYAPLGTTLPTDATTDLDSAFKPLGYVGEDGIQPSRDTSIEKPKSWRGDTLASLLTDDSLSFVHKMVEVFQENLNKFVYGSSNVTYTAATTSAATTIEIKDKAYKPDKCVLVYEMVYGVARVRLILPVADTVVTGEDPYVAGGVTAYELTVEALKDSTGVRAYRYMDLGDKLAA